MGQAVQDSIFVLFDLDGTLGDTGRVHYLTQSAIAREFLQCSIDQRLWNSQCAGKDHGGILDVFRRHASANTEMTSDEFIWLCERAFEDKKDLIQPVEGMKELVDQLSVAPHVHMGVNSNSSRGIVDTALVAMDMDINIEHCVSTTELAAKGVASKPAPDSYVMLKEQICQAQGIERPQVIYIFEDSPSGLLAGGRAAQIFEEQGIPTSVVQIASAQHTDWALQRHREANVIVEPGAGVVDLAPLIAQGQSLGRLGGRAQPQVSSQDAAHLKI